MTAVFPLALLDNPVTLLILGVIAVLLFGERLPEVGRTVGKRFVEFKRGLQKIEQEIRSAAMSVTSTIESPSSSSSHSSQSSDRHDGPAAGDEHAEDHDVATAPKFEPPKEPADGKVA
ncbi:MAG: twin-arginine translocase TatA/TatE family subunit [Tepidisphaeraceae bacterium]|jgi:sec-independent protein translocase protein TatA